MSIKMTSDELKKHTSLKHLCGILLDEITSISLNEYTNEEVEELTNVLETSLLNTFSVLQNDDVILTKNERKNYFARIYSKII